MKKLKYLLFLLIFTNCAKDSLNSPDIIVTDPDPDPDPELLGEIWYSPIQNPFYTWQLNSEIIDNKIYAIGACYPEANNEGIFFAKFDNSLELLENIFPLTGFFQVETRRLKSYSNNNNLYISHTSTTDFSASSKIMKTTLNGDVVWQHEFSNNLFVNNFVSINNNLFLSCNKDWISISNSLDLPVSIIVLNDSGNLINQIDLGDVYTSGNDILALDDNSLVITCLKRDGGNNDIKPNIINFDNEGNILWELQLDYFDDFIFKYDKFFIEKGNDAIYFVFTNRSGGAFQIGKISFNGSLIWKEDVVVPDFPQNATFEYIDDIILDNENNIYLIGSEKGHPSFPRHMAIVKYSSNGELLKSYIHNALEYWGKSLEIINNEELITFSKITTNSKISLIKFNLNLEMQ